MIGYNVTHAHLHHLHHLLHPCMQTLNILRTTVETESFGMYLVDAFHESANVYAIHVHPIVDGIVGDLMTHYDMDSLPDLVERLNVILREDME